MKKIALVGGYLIDGTGREPLVNSLVLVEGKNITECLCRTCQANLS